MPRSGQPRMLGLEDPSVIICKNRGESDYNKNHPPTSPVEPTYPDHSRCTHKYNLTAWVKCELGRTLVRYPPDSHSSYFIPRNKLRCIATPQRIRQIIDELACYQNHTAAQKDRLRDTICFGDARKQCWKLLIVLLAADLQEHLFSLIRDNVSDECLPLGVGTAPKCRVEDHRHSTIAAWPDWIRCDVSKWSYAVKAPYFTRPPNQHNHYILDLMDVLPISAVDDFTSDAPQRKTGKTGNGNDIVNGGFGEVEKVIIDESHYDFETLDGQDLGGRRRQFALKRLYATTRDIFNQELISLRRFQHDKDDHLIELLASFEIKEKRGGKDITTYCLLFPWAEGDLWSFWKIHGYISEEQRFPKCLWMSDQIYKIARALMRVHNERRRQLKQLDKTIKDSKLELFGRHGDIKAENILWFKDKNIVTGLVSNERLVIADFGLGRLNSKYSRSGVDPKNVERTATYKAPEFDLHKGRISRVSDIFSFGCLCLEFVTWYLKGWTSVANEFPEYRMEEDIHGMESDIFFTIEGHSNSDDQTDAKGRKKGKGKGKGREVDEEGAEERAIVKPKVRAWIMELKKSEHCTAYILQFLELIEQRMLEPDPKKRIKSDELVKELKLFADTCRTDSDFYQKYCGWL